MDAIGLGEIAAFAGLALSVIGSHLRQQQRQDAQLAEIKAEFSRLNDAINHRAERVDDKFGRVEEKLVEAEQSRGRLGARIGHAERAISACEKRHDIAEARLGMPT